MIIIKQITDQVNHGQTPVLTVDQPLYAIAKRIQWKWPEQYGEQNYVVLMGGLHIENAILKVLGDWLDGSGWTYIMSALIVSKKVHIYLEVSEHIRLQQLLCKFSFTRHMMSTKSITQIMSNNTSPIGVNRVL